MAGGKSLIPRQVKLYAILREVVKQDELTVWTAEKVIAEDLLTQIALDQPKLSSYLRNVVVAEGDEYRSRADWITGNRDIALLPPVSGGAGNYLTFQPIRLDEISHRLYHPEAGAVVTFLGTVRAELDKSPIALLDYEAHEILAEKEMEKIVSETKSRWQIFELALVHRLGTVPVGETSLFIGVATRHRDEAYEASRFILEAVKHRVPIWKKEVFADQTVAWPAGEVLVR